VEADGDAVVVGVEGAAGVEEAALQGVGGSCHVAGAEAAGEGGADGAGEHGQHDVEVDLEGHGGGEGVEVEAADGFGEALFDGHAPGVAFDDLAGGGAAVVGDDDRGGVAAEAAHDELADAAGVAGEGGLSVDEVGFAVAAVAVERDGVPRGGSRLSMWHTSDAERMRRVMNRMPHASSSPSTCCGGVIASTSRGDGG
jgi:hypothetical protein